MKPALLLAQVALTLSLLPASASDGQPVASYALCAACHAPDGKGLNAGTPMPMAPPLAGSKLATAGDGEAMAAIILNGIQKEDTKFLGIMAPLGPALTDAQLAEVMTYVRSSFGNQAPAVTEAQAKSWREKYNGKPMWTRKALDDLLKQLVK